VRQAEKCAPPDCGGGLLRSQRRPELVITARRAAVLYVDWSAIVDAVPQTDPGHRAWISPVVQPDEWKLLCGAESVGHLPLLRQLEPAPRQGLSAHLPRTVPRRVSATGSARPPAPFARSGTLSGLPLLRAAGFGAIILVVRRAGCARSRSGGGHGPAPTVRVGACRARRSFRPRLAAPAEGAGPGGRFRCGTHGWSRPG
jgi:hypothetical protein